MEEIFLRDILGVLQRIENVLEKQNRILGRLKVENYISNSPLNLLGEYFKAVDEPNQDCTCDKRGETSAVIPCPLHG